MYPKASASIRAVVHYAENAWLHSAGATRLLTRARATTLLSVSLLVCLSTFTLAQETAVRSVSGLSSITFVENTSGNTEYTFSDPFNNTVLLTRLPDPLTTEDFHGVQTELYDVFYSRADGSPLNDGAYITIEAVWDHQAPSGGGLNISEVRLNRGPQFEYGNVVSSAVYLGNNAIPDSAARAVDGNLGTDCSMGNTVGLGNQRLRVTVGFGSSSGGPTNPPQFTCIWALGGDGDYVACNIPSSGFFVVDIFNHSGVDRQIDWVIDGANQFIVSPSSGSINATPGHNFVNFDADCDCPAFTETVTFRTTNLGADNCMATATWHCDHALPVPALTTWWMIALALFMIGIGSALLWRQRRDVTQKATCR